MTPLPLSVCARSQRPMFPINYLDFQNRKYFYTSQLCSSVEFSHYECYRLHLYLTSQNVSSYSQQWGVWQELHCLDCDWLKSWWMCRNIQEHNSSQNVLFTAFHLQYLAGQEGLGGGWRVSEGNNKPEKNDLLFWAVMESSPLAPLCRVLFCQHWPLLFFVLTRQTLFPLNIYDWIGPTYYSPSSISCSVISKVLFLRFPTCQPHSSLFTWQVLLYSEILIPIIMTTLNNYSLLPHAPLVLGGMLPVC